PVAVVDVEKVVFLEVVRDVQVRAAVEVYVGGDSDEPESLDPVVAVVDAGGGADVHEMTAIVAIQTVRRCRVRCRLGVPFPDAPLRGRRAVEGTHVEAAGA